MEFARKNMRVFEEMQCDAIVVNVAGCGAMLKEYHHLLPAAEREAAKQFESKVRDVSQFLDELQIDPPKHSLPIKLTYHDACHLCHAQQVRSAPRRLLESIPGMRMVPLEESEVCCGAAGTYNLTQPEMSQKLADRKAKQIIATGAQVVAMGNIGCQLQVERGLRSLNSDIEVVHTVELLDRAYSAIEPA
jgi:glycolate oxidase iron-sulfur subunit